MHDKHEQLGEFGAIPGAPNGPPAGACSAAPFEIHPAANIFPPMRDKEFQELKASIAAQGLFEPIWTYQGKVIDGRHRLRACTELVIPPRYQEWDGKGSLLDFVISLNLHRRHLKEAQRAMVAARIKPQFEEEARKREHAGKRVDPQTNSSEGQARDQAAQLLSVGTTSVTLACRILANGVPELIAAVDACKIAVSTASDLADLPKHEQTRVLAAGRDEIRKVLQPIREKRKKKRPDEVDRRVTPAPHKQLDPALEKKLLNHFNNGWVKLTKNEQGFRMQFCEYFLDELHRAMSHPYFKTLMEQGVTMIKVEKGAA
jgi:hypothetical protein